MDLVEGGVVAADDAGVVTRHAAVDLTLEKSLIKDDKINKKVVPVNTNDKATSLSSFVLSCVQGFSSVETIRYYWDDKTTFLFT